MSCLIYCPFISPSSSDDFATLHQNNLINPLLRISLLRSPLHPLPRTNPCLVHVKLVHPDPSPEPLFIVFRILVPGIAAEAAATRVAHPQLGLRFVILFLGFRVGERAVVIYVIVAAAYGHHALVHERLLEAAVEAGCGGRFEGFPAGFDDVGCVAVFGERDMDECHIHAHMAGVVVQGGFLELFACRAEPVDLGFLQPVVAAEVALVGAVAVGVEEVERYGGGVLRGFVGEDFEVVVPHAVDGGFSRDAKAVWEGFRELHHCRAREAAFVVVIPEYGSKGDGAADEQLGVFEDGGLSIWSALAIYLVSREDNKIRLLSVKNRAHEFECARVGVAFPAMEGRGFGIAAYAKAGAEVEVGNLEDFEFSIFADA